MSKTLSFVRLDLYLLKSYAYSVLLMLAMGASMGLVFQSSGIILYYFMMMIMLVISYPFAIAEKDGLDILYGTLSLTKRDIVIGRYLFCIILAAIGAVSGFFASFAFSFFIDDTFVVKQTLFSIYLMLCGFFLIVALQCPIFFKLGYAKAKILSMIPLFAVFIVLLQLPNLSRIFGWDISWEKLVEIFIEGSPMGFGLSNAIPGFAVSILVVLSCILSCWLYKNRE